MKRYGRADILRILRISPRQLTAWQRVGLAPVTEEYSFYDLLQIRTIRDLRAKQVRAADIRESLEAMRKYVLGMENPLAEASTVNIGRRVAFRHQGRTLEPVHGQFVMDFQPVGRMVSSTVRPISTCETAADLFLRGVALESHPTTHDEAIATYLRVIELEPEHAAAHINVGTLYYHRQDFGAAERHYRAAVNADPRYALAYFDLGNVLDETGRIAEAVAAYRTALQLAPTYADAHYNLALAYERQKQPRQALQHWKAYTKLDKIGPWSVHARNRISRILENDTLKMVYRRQG